MNCYLLIGCVNRHFVKIFKQNLNYSLNSEYTISVCNNANKLNSLVEEMIINITKENVLQDNEVTEVKSFF